MDTSAGREEPVISALIVNYNGGDLLTRSVAHLEEAAAGLEGALEVIVADNGSRDGSLEPLRSRPGVRLLELGENLGFGPANNRAASEARADRLLLLNSDAWPEAGCLEKLLAALDADPRLGLVAPRLFYPDGRPQFHWAPTTSILGEAVQLVRNRCESLPLTHRLRLGVGWYTAACVLLRKSAFEEIGGFDERYFLYFEDVDLCLRLRAAGWKLDDVPEARAVHVKGGSQPSGQSELYYRQGQLRYYARHRPAWEHAFIRRKLRRKFGRREEPERSRLLRLLGK